MLALMKKRQSGPSASVDPTDQQAKVRYLAEQIRKAMVRRGWVDTKGNPDVGRLHAAVSKDLDTEVRWQTVQYWIQGKTKRLPEVEHLYSVARVLDMTLDELIGIAAGTEPTNKAWAAFLETEEGGKMTPRQRALVARLVTDGEPTVSAYLFMLAAVKAGSS